MELIFNNQFSIFEDIFYTYLTPKQCVKLYSCNKILYNIYINNNKFESNYFTPKDRIELKNAVNEWCSNKEEAIIKYGNIGYWNTIYIVNMGYLFYTNKKEFNDNIEDWNTSNVIDMSGMFYNALSFNQPLNNWNTSNVIYMQFMFYNNENFNQNLNNWNISNVTHMHHMFYNAVSFNQLINDWNISNVQTIYCMFYNVISFNPDNYKNCDLTNVQVKYLDK